MTAKAFAIKAHGEQRYGDLLYAAHLAAVEEVLLRFGFRDEALLNAAWLHDVVEDTEIRLNFIPKIGTATLTQFVTPDVIATERVYLYP